MLILINKQKKRR